MVIEAVKALSAEEISELCLRHTLYDWSAQAALKPMAVASAKGVHFHTVDGRRFIDFNSQLMCVNAGHGDQRIIDAIKRQADLLPYISPFMATEVRARLGQKLAELLPGDIDKVLFTLGGNDANENAIKIARDRHRPLEDPGALPLLPRRHRHRHPGHRRPAALAERGRGRRRPRARPVPRHPARHRHRGGRARDARGNDRPGRREHDRRVHPRADHRHQRHPDPARRLPPGGARALRPPRHPADRRRGDDRLRAHRPLVRRRSLGRRARPHHPRQGPDQQLRPAWRGRHAAEGRRLFRRPRLLRRADLQQPPARRALRRWARSRHTKRTTWSATRSGWARS